MKIFGFILAILALVLGLGWLMQGNDFFLYKVFAPKYEQVRRETFEQSKAYNQGMSQNLQKMQFEYVQADKDAKPALASIILQRFADYDLTKLPPEQRLFLEQLRAVRTTEK
jgi:hypothetical protein